jgi:hypothetical protein
MCRVFNSLLAVTAVGGIAGIGGFVKSSRSPSMEGAWQAVEVSMTGPGARTIRPLQPNLSIFTAKHYSHIDIHADGPRPTVTDPAKASADELRQAWGPVVAEAGSYETSGGSFTTHPVVAKNPAAMVKGSFTSYSYRIAGDTLWLTMQRTERGAVPNPPTIKLTRVE